MLIILSVELASNVFKLSSLVPLVYVSKLNLYDILAEFKDGYYGSKAYI